MCDKLIWLPATCWAHVNIMVSYPYRIVSYHDNSPSLNIFRQNWKHICCCCCCWFLLLPIRAEFQSFVCFLPTSTNIIRCGCDGVSVILHLLTSLVSTRDHRAFRAQRVSFLGVRCNHYNIPSVAWSRPKVWCRPSAEVNSATSVAGLQAMIVQITRKQLVNILRRDRNTVVSCLPALFEHCVIRRLPHHLLSSVRVHLYQHLVQQWHQRRKLYISDTEISALLKTRRARVCVCVQWFTYSGQWSSLQLLKATFVLKSTQPPTLRGMENEWQLTGGGLRGEGEGGGGMSAVLHRTYICQNRADNVYSLNQTQ